MKTIISRLCFLSLAAMLASCNLFIDDELQENEFKNVRVHHGEGYDGLVSTHESGCDMEYQFNDDVLVVEETTQESYITDIRSDEDNMNLIVCFRADTPKDLLPQAGEIFLSKSTSKFPMGANHRVLECEQEGGVYQCVMTFATLKDTFKELHVNGSVVFGTDSFAVEVPRYEEEAEAAARTRAEEGPDLTAAEVKLEGDKIEFNLPFSLSFNMTFPNGAHGEVIINKDKNFYKVTNEFKFDDFSLDNMKADYVQTIEEKAGIVLSGGFTKTFTLIKDLYLLKNKPVAIGYLVLVFWISADLYLDLDVTASITISKNKKYQNIYHLDLYEGTMNKETKVLKDGDWEVDATISGSIGLRAELTFGMGIYGRVLSVRVIPVFTATATLTIPIITHESSTRLFDLSNAAGLAFSIDFSVKLGIFLDLSLDALLGKSNSTKQLVDRVKSGDAEAKKLFDELANKEAEERNRDELGIFDTFGPWNLFSRSFTWYPHLDDGSFKIIRSWDKSSQQMSFSAEYKLSRLGFWVAMGKQFTPGLMIKKGKKYITTIFPNEGGTSAKCSTSKTYTFNIPIDNKEEDIMYTAYPCFFDLPWGSRLVPNAFDKGLPFCNTSPKITITNAEPYALEVDWLAENGTGEFIDDDIYEYAYNYGVKTYTSVKGASNIQSWEIEENSTKTTHKYNKKNDEKQKDGTYIMYWEFTVYRKNKKAFSKDLHFRPKFKVKGSSTYDGNVYEPYTLILKNDRTYDFMDPNGFTMQGQTYSRLRGGLDDESDDKSVTKGRLNAVVDADGEVVWQRPGFHLPTAADEEPFTRM